MEDVADVEDGDRSEPGEDDLEGGDDARRRGAVLLVDERGEGGVEELRGGHQGQGGGEEGVHLAAPVDALHGVDGVLLPAARVASSPRAGGVSCAAPPCET